MDFARGKARAVGGEPSIVDDKKAVGRSFRANPLLNFQAMPEPVAAGDDHKSLRQSSLASLKSTRGFLALYKQGKWVHGPSLSLGWMPNATQGSRVGIRTRKGLKGAVVRNRLKRQLRAVLRVTQLIPRQSVDIVLVLHPRKQTIDSEHLAKELCQLFQTARLL